MNKLRDMTQAFADAIREAIEATPELTDACRVTVLVEDKLNANFAIDDNLGRNGICIIVGVTGFNRKQSTGSIVYGTINFDVSIFENPAMSRETEYAPTAQTVAEFVATRLHWRRPCDWHSPLLFGGMTRSDEYPCVIERLTFTTDAEIQS